MPAIIAMLRGVNVGGHNLISMPALRALCGSLGLENIQTYVQSGNVVFMSGERNLEALTKRIEAALDKACGSRITVMLRTSAEMRTVIAQNPFAKRSKVEPNKLLVTFLAKAISPEAQWQLETIKAGSEEVKARAREVYVYYPDGMGRSKLPAAMERVLKKTGTARNWNSVTKLLEMAAGLEEPLG